MFNGCTNLKAILVDDGWVGGSNDDGSWKNDKIRSSTYMFRDCTSLVGEDGTMVGEKTDYGYAHTGEGGYLTKKTISLPVTNNGGDGYYYSTYFKSNVNRQADEDTEVFIGTVDEGWNELKLTKVDDRIIMAGEGVILRRASSGDATLTSIVDESTADYTTNMLDGVERTTPTSDISGTVYVLNKVDNRLGFFHYTGENLKGQKAYLTLGYNEARGLVFSFEDGTTGICEMEEGRMANETGGIYDLSGRKLSSSSTPDAISRLRKGMYIVNGKKVFIER